MHVRVKLDRLIVAGAACSLVGLGALGTARAAPAVAPGAAHGTAPSSRSTSSESWEDASDPVAGPAPTREYVLEVNRRARGFGIGYDNGLWGGGFAQGVHVDVPFGWKVGQFFGMRLRGVAAYGPATASFDPVMFGGAELFGRTPVMLGLVRMYGGGGVYLGGRPSNDAVGRTTGVTGGGHLGIETFLNPGYSFSVEIGGQGGIHPQGVDAGPSVMGGMTVYLGGG